jgi:hypothetical protein
MVSGIDDFGYVMPTHEEARHAVRCVSAFHDSNITPREGIVKELVETLKFTNEQIGWKGSGPEDKDKYYCEHCAGSPQDDCLDIVHEDTCLVLKVRAALKKAIP